MCYAVGMGKVYFFRFFSKRRTFFNFVSIYIIFSLVITGGYTFEIPVNSDLLSPSSQVGQVSNYFESTGEIAQNESNLSNSDSREILEKIHVSERTEPVVRALKKALAPKPALIQWVKEYWQSEYATPHASLIQELEDFSNALEAYDTGKILEVRIARHAPFDGGVKVLFLRTEKGSFILKRYPEILDKEYFLKTVALRKGVEQSELSFNIPGEIQTKSGKYSTDVNNRSYILYPYEGPSMRFSEFDADTLSRVLAQTLAVFHESVKNSEVSNLRSGGAYQLEMNHVEKLAEDIQRFTKSIQSMPARYTKTIARQHVLSSEFQSLMAEEIHKLGQSLPAELYEKLPKTMNHGDFHSGNLIMDEAGAPIAILDVDDARLESRLLDISHGFMSVINKSYQIETGYPNPENVLELLQSFLMHYRIAEVSGQAFSNEEISALKSYLKGDALYEIFYRLDLLSHQGEFDYFNSPEGDSRFYNELIQFTKLLRLLDKIDFNALQNHIQEEAFILAQIQIVLQILADKNLDPFLVPSGEIVNSVCVSTGIDTHKVRRVMENLRSQQIQVQLKRSKSLELKYLNFIEKSPEKAIGYLKEAISILERVSVSSGFYERYLSEYARLNRVLEKISFENPCILTPERKNHIVLIPTKNRSVALLNLLQSIVEEFNLFEFGRFDPNHVIQIIIIEDSDQPKEISANRKTVEKIQKQLKAYSENYLLTYWGSDEQEADLNSINREVFNNQWDIRNILYSDDKAKADGVKNYSRARNLGLIAARLNARSFQDPQETIVTWLDDDARMGTTIKDASGKVKNSQHVFNYFQKTQTAFYQERLGVLLGGDTADSSNSLTHFSVYEDLLSVFEFASQSSENALLIPPSLPPFSISYGEDPKTNGDLVRLCLKSATEFRYGRNPLRMIEYYPEDISMREDSTLPFTGEQRIGSGNNASFLLGAFEGMQTYLPGIERGEDLFKNIADAGLLKPGLKFLNSNFNAIDNFRLPGTRESIISEVFKHYRGVTPVKAYAQLIKNLIRHKTGGVKTGEDTFLNLEHKSRMKTEWLGSLRDPENYLSFEEWKQAALDNYNYILGFIQRAQKAAESISEKGYLTDMSRKEYYWLHDPAYSDPLKILKEDILPFLDDENIFERLKEEHEKLIASEEAYWSFLDSLKKNTANQENWHKFWSYENSVSITEDDEEELWPSVDSYAFMEHQNKLYHRFLAGVFFLAGFALGVIPGMLIAQSLVGPSMLVVFCVAGLFSCVIGICFLIVHDFLFSEPAIDQFTNVIKVLKQVHHNLAEILTIEQTLKMIREDPDSDVMRHVIEKAIKISHKSQNEKFLHSEFETRDFAATVIYKTPNGTPYRSLFKVREGTMDENKIGLEYSLMKFGRRREVNQFSEFLTKQIIHEIGDEIRKNPTSWVVVNPAGVGIPNAAVLLAQQVARQLNLPHYSLMAPLASQRSLQNKLASKDRTNNWKLFDQLKQSYILPSDLQGANIIFIDDGVLTGTILQNDAVFLKEMGSPRFEAFTVAKLETTESENFEKKIDLKLLSEFDIYPLVDVLNDIESQMTTRVINYAFQLDGIQFQRVLERLTPEAKLNLLISSLEYYRNKPPVNFDSLVESLETDVGLPFPRSDDYRDVTSDEFYIQSVLYLKKTHYRIPVNQAKKISGTLWKQIYAFKGQSTNLFVFDLDKTLVHSEPYYRWVKEASISVLEAHTGYSREIILRKVDFIRNALTSQGRSLRQRDIAIEFDIDPLEFDRLIAEKLDLGSVIDANPELMTLLDNLKRQGKKIALLTDSARQQTIKILNALGIEDYFDLIVTSPETGLQKPDGELYQQILNHFKMSASEAVMAGDSMKYDIEPARHLGMKIWKIQSKYDLWEIPGMENLPDQRYNREKMWPDLLNVSRHSANGEDFLERISVYFYEQALSHKILIEDTVLARFILQLLKIKSERSNIEIEDLQAIIRSTPKIAA